MAVAETWRKIGERGFHVTVQNKVQQLGEYYSLATRKGLRAV
jgi:hypothetical protein